MKFIYDGTREIRVAEIKLMDLDEFKLITAQVDCPIQAIEMAKLHSIHALKWVRQVMEDTNKLHRDLKCN